MNNQYKTSVYLKLQEHVTAIDNLKETVKN